MKRKPLIQLLVLTSVLLAIAGGVWLSTRPALDIPKFTATARERLSDGDLVEAGRLARTILDADQENEAARLILAEIDARTERESEALAACERLLERSTDDEIRKACSLLSGNLLLQRGLAKQAEDSYREALRIDPLFVAAHHSLGMKLETEGRRWESAPHLLELVKLDHFSSLHLMLLANPRQNLRVEDYLQRIANSGEDYPPARLAEARELVRQGDYDAAGEIAHACLRLDPGQVEVTMLAGELLVLARRWDEFVAWSEKLTENHERHPEAWRLRGEWCLAQSKVDEALRCFGEAFVRDPNDSSVCSQMAQLLLQRDAEPELCEYFRGRVAILDELSTLANSLHENPRNLTLIQNAMRCCLYLERYWEAWGWCRVALTIDPRLDWADASERELVAVLTPDLPRTVLFGRRAPWDFRAYPLPSKRGTISTEPPSEIVAAGGAIAFEDVAASVGLTMTPEFGESEDEASTGRLMFQMTGGGVGVLDYDLDGCPDLYFSQGTKTLEGPFDSSVTDRLFRNQGGKSFRDVTELAGIVEEFYSQGVNVGDLNNDGFPDLYVGNIGSNRLFWNNGDGTFTRGTDATFDSATGWTTSVAIADLDGDGIPDLYDVNYLESNAYYRRCDVGGQPRTCSPRIFRGLRDRLLHGTGRGTFEDHSAALPDGAEQGRGLGIVIADFFETGRPEIFVANDTVANNLYRFLSPADSAEWSLQDDALLKGVAFDARGRAQACMGIAFDDFNRDRQIDLFVTNYYGEHNSLYLRSRNTFADLTHTTGISSFSYHMLGFGTQAVDADLDGWPDLFVANGHIDDYSHTGIPYRMRPQLYRNAGQGRFEDLDPAAVGTYFSRELLGRAAARLDWNRDGRQDVVVTHLESAPALLENRSETVLEPLAVLLIGTQGSRDALGARLTLTQGERVYAAQVQLGSGYFAANEQRIVFPVANEGEITLEIVWPGSREAVKYASFQPGREYRIVEGRAEAVAIP